MTRTLRLFASLFVLAALAVAGDCPSGGACCNQCPLAKEAVHHYASGTEALRTSPTVRADFVRTVVANLRSI